MFFYEHFSTPLHTSRRNKHFDFPFHMHALVEFIYVTSGEMQLGFPDAVFLLHPGDFAVVFPCQIHNLTTLTEKADYTIAVCSKELSADFNDILFNQSTINPVIPAEMLPGDIRDLMYELSSYEKKSLDNPRLIKSIISLILARTLSLMNLDTRSDHSESTLVAQALNYVYTHFREELSLDTLARELGVSRYAVSRIFTSVVKVKFTLYVNSIRVDFAKQLLRNTSQSILDIALESGFETLRSFNRVFKSITGSTPLSYRKAKLTVSPGTVS
ncbi:MAG: helix-turn-helix domain-containing protein [Lachnospiraceae bacterium]|nr:helix-turn-helix domain-containing protein [Lachnospiraceae bacterium]